MAVEVEVVLRRESRVDEDEAEEISSAVIGIGFGLVRYGSCCWR